MPTSQRARWRAAAALGAGLTLAACATTTPPPRFSPVSPADAGAAEGALPPPPPLLTGDGELAERGSGARPETPEADLTTPSQPRHEGHGALLSSEATYTCAMHPEVQAKEPGKCSTCGMTLVKKAAKPEDRP